MRNESRAEPVKAKYPEAKFVYGDLSASDVIEKAAAEADIVIRECPPSLTPASHACSMITPIHSKASTFPAYPVR